jgi:CRP-like cAMP-binding protein
MSDSGQRRISRELFLAGFGIALDEIDPWAIDRMTSLLDEQDFRAGDVLYSRGDAPDHIYFMQDGAVRMSKPGSSPWTFRGRWLLGVYDAFSEQGRTRDAVALTDFHTMHVSVPSWLELLEDNPRLARAAVTNSARGVAQLEERLPTGPPRPPRVVSPLGPARSARLSLVDRLAALVDVRMLRGAGVQALVDLAADSEEVSFERDQVILPRGVERDRMLLVVDGEVLSSRADPPVERRHVAGDIVGGVCAFGSPALAWEARALSPGVGIAFAIEAWFDLMEEHFDLVRSTLAALMRRRELLMDHLAEASGGLVLT